MTKSTWLAHAFIMRTGLSADILMFNHLPHLMESEFAQSTLALSTASVHRRHHLSPRQPERANYSPRLLFRAREAPRGMDVMRAGAQKAIYPAFVLLPSFKKANSLEADREREREWQMRDIDSYIKWIRLIKKASTAHILSTSFKHRPGGHVYRR